MRASRQDAGATKKPQARVGALVGRALGYNEGRYVVRQKQIPRPKHRGLGMTPLLKWRRSTSERRHLRIVSTSLPFPERRV